MKRILYLYVEVMPYNLPVFRSLVRNGYELVVVQIDKGKLTPFKYCGEEGIVVRNLSSYDGYFSFFEDNYMKDVCLVYMSEQFNAWYWRLARQYRKDNKISVVVGCDAQWTGKRNNYLKKLFFSITYKRVFTHIQCAGTWQVDYAMRIGFKRNQIITPLLCADNQLYNKVDIETKIASYPRRFLFVGRLSEVKGISDILDAWDGIVDKQGWTLTFIGNGSMTGIIEKHRDVELKPFMNQADICMIMQNSGCALVPSHFEPWGLVIHEAATAGLPIIVSKECGATYRFVIDGYNGYCIQGGNVESLRRAMSEIISASTSTLIEMSYRSRELSQSILPDHVAYSLLSLINK